MSIPFRIDLITQFPWQFQIFSGICGLLVAAWFYFFFALQPDVIAAQRRELPTEQRREAKADGEPSGNPTVSNQGGAGNTNVQAGPNSTIYVQSPSASLADASQIDRLSLYPRIDEQGRLQLVFENQGNVATVIAVVIHKVGDPELEHRGPVVPTAHYRLEPSLDDLPLRQSVSLPVLFAIPANAVDSFTIDLRAIKVWDIEGFALLRDGRKKTFKLRTIFQLSQ